MDWIFAHENSLRLLSFATGYLVFFALGLLIPYREIKTKDRFPRWWRNLFFVFGNSLLLRILVPVSLTGIAIHTEAGGGGIFNQFHMPMGVEILLSILLLDLIIYWQHRLFHTVPIFWRLHRLHHTDTELDVTTAGRFHPAEILLSYALKVIAVVVLGISPVTIIVFEILLNFFAMFNHGNFRLPKTIEPVVRSLLVTPSMHRVHHSTRPEETNSNYGNCFSFWDRLFASYRKNSLEHPRKMPIGLTEFRSTDEQTLWALLIQPFRSGRQ